MLASHIYRQRLIIEGYSNFLTVQNIDKLLVQLSKKLKMTILGHVETRYNEEVKGWAAWCHWTTSGCHLYTWDKDRFFSVDIYTCKEFDIDTAIEVVKEIINPVELEYKQI